MSKRMPYGEVTLAEVRAVFPGLAALAEASVSRPVDVDTATWIEGPGFVRWLWAHGLNSHRQFGTSFERSLHRWELGGAVKIEVADRILVDLGYHLHDLPDVLWRHPPRHIRQLGLQRRTDDDRRAAVRRVQAGETAGQVARDLDVDAAAVRKWVRKFTL